MPVCLVIQSDRYGAASNIRSGSFKMAGKDEGTKIFNLTTQLSA